MTAETVSETAGTGAAECECATFEFASDGAAWKGIPVVNGHKVMTVTSFDVHVDAGSFPAVTLNLCSSDSLDLALKDETSVRFGDETREALISLGWTPPDGDGGRQRIVLDLEWTEDGDKHRELFGLWTSGDLMAAHAFLREWASVNGHAVTGTVFMMNDPDEWRREHSG